MDESDLQRLTISALETARLRIERSLRANGIPLSYVEKRLLIDSNEDGTSWTTHYEDCAVNSLRNSPLVYTVGEIFAHRLVLGGVTDELRELASYLHEQTDLAVPASKYMPHESGPDAIIGRYLGQIISNYILSLRTVADGDLDLAECLAGEMYEFATGDSITHCYQIAVSGVVPSSPLSYRQVSIRLLSPYERGVFAEHDRSPFVPSDISDSDFVIPWSMRSGGPTSLIEVSSTRPKSEQWDSSTLATRVALSFFLHDFELSSTGVIVGFDRPQWTSSGRSHQPFAINEKFAGPAAALDRASFESIVDLAYVTPSFGTAEDGAQQIALSRTLRGCGVGTFESGFLDFAIALEAALIGGAQQELSYRFCLYGAIFLRDELPAKETFRRLKNIYEVRSKLVHGGAVKQSKISEANADAPVLAKAVIRKAVESGWPEPKLLDSLAISLPRKCNSRGLDPTHGAS
jgi:hypothetical protein